MSSKILEYLNDTPDIEITAKIGLRVKELRKGLNLTQDELATRAGVSQSTISKLEGGALSDIGAIKLTKIGCALGLSLHPWWLE